MKYVFKDLANIKKKLQESNFVLLLDFDLTLSPLAKNPAKAILPNDTRILLKKLSKYIHTAVITGRTIKDIKKRIKLNSLTYVGNHGLEYEVGGVARSSQLLVESKKGLKDIKKKFLNIERKNYGLRGILYKRTLEVRPETKEDKGTASLLILKKFGNPKQVIYIGDGKTDEDAFRALPKGITIRVGKSKHSVAEYYVNSTKEVKKFLVWLLYIV